MTKGSIYIFWNPAYPILVKIGQTQKPVQTRADQLNAQTSNPDNFERIAEWVVNDVSVERVIHTKLHEYRYKKEYFEMSDHEAVVQVGRILHAAPTMISPRLKVIDGFQDKADRKIDVARANRASKKGSGHRDQQPRTTGERKSAFNPGCSDEIAKYILANANVPRMKIDENARGRSVIKSGGKHIIKIVSFQKVSRVYVRCADDRKRNVTSHGWYRDSMPVRKRSDLPRVVRWLNDEWS